MTAIYVLKDQSGEVRYVGKTAKSLETRFKKHMDEAKYGNGTYHKANWLRKCIRDNALPTIELIDTVDDDGCDDERFWIWVCKNDCKYDLTNATDGGEGLPNPSPETRAKIGAASRSRTYPKGKICAAETRARISAAKRGKPNSVAHNRKMGLSKLGKPLAEFHRERISDGLKGRTLSDDHRRRLSENKKAYYAARRIGGENDDI